jgi:hypothetical protein
MRSSRMSSAKPAKGWSCRPATGRRGLRPPKCWPGIEVIGVIGARAQARPLIDALGLRWRGDGAGRRRSALHALPLRRPCRARRGPGNCAALARRPRIMVTTGAALHRAMSWNPPAKAGHQAEADIEKLSRGRYAPGSDRAGWPAARDRVQRANAPSCRSAGSTRPKPLRGQGHARRAVALHLAEARAERSRLRHAICVRGTGGAGLSRPSGFAA